MRWEGLHELRRTRLAARRRRYARIFASAPQMSMVHQVRDRFRE